MFYAEFCPYGIRTISDGDMLMAFETREERDEMVESINYAHSERVDGCAVAVTTREVSHRYTSTTLRTTTHARFRTSARARESASSRFTTSQATCSER